MLLRSLLHSTFFCGILAFSLFLTYAGCSSSRHTASADRDEYEEYEEEEEEFGKAPAPPPPWSDPRMFIAPAEKPSDLLRFHIGSPFFLRLKVTDRDACAPFSGQPFYFDAPGSQLGWGFREISDSLLFPIPPGSCERVVMLSSENSNRIAEGTYTLKIQLFMDADHRVNSDTIALQAIRSTTGADTLSYVRFLQEQIINNSPLLTDPETMRALFAEGTPRSAESEIYRAIILYRAGNPAAADEALLSARRLGERRAAPLDENAAAARDALVRAIGRGTSSR